MKIQILARDHVVEIHKECEIEDFRFENVFKPV
jgi:hypothetical protein